MTTINKKGHRTDPCEISNSTKRTQSKTLEIKKGCQGGGLGIEIIDNGSHQELKRLSTLPGQKVFGTGGIGASVATGEIKFSSIPDLANDENLVSGN
ncbi:hypothetical protein J6590_083791 [Homalodisca vitripennis]|nr:hypothetical protein J6590_083791 [Homalodisca vitripennis]